MSVGGNWEKFREICLKHKKEILIIQDVAYNMNFSPLPARAYPLLLQCIMDNPEMSSSDSRVDVFHVLTLSFRYNNIFQ